MGSTVQTLLNGKTLEAYAKLVDNDCRDYQNCAGSFSEKVWGWPQRPAGLHSGLQGKDLITPFLNWL